VDARAELAVHAPQHVDVAVDDHHLRALPTAICAALEPTTPPPRMTMRADGTPATPPSRTPMPPCAFSRQ
jgi:hypothetical protein